MPVSETGCQNGGAGDLLWTPAGIPVGPAPVPPLRGPEALRGSERPDPTPAGRKAGGTHGRWGEGAVTPTIAAPAASLLRSVSTLSQSTFAVHAARDSPSPPGPECPLPRRPRQCGSVWGVSGDAAAPLPSPRACGLSLRPRPAPAPSWRFRGQPLPRAQAWPQRGARPGPAPSPLSTTGRPERAGPKQSQGEALALG